MAQKAKFKLLNKYDLTAGIQIHDVELTDADNDVSKYLITDYYNSSKTKIAETTIEKIGEYIEGSEQIPAEVDEYIDVDSYLGKKIIEFIEEGENMSKSEQTELQNYELHKKININKLRRRITKYC
jgi:hypothetical protein